MSQDEIDLEIGRLYREQETAKRERSALLGQAGRYSDILKGVAMRLSSAEYQATTLPDNYPSADELRAVLDGLARTSGTIQRIANALSRSD